MTTEPIALGSIAWETIPPTATSVSPAAAALSRSTTTAMYGSDADRLLVATAVTSSFSTEASTASAAVRRSSASFAVMFTRMSEDAKPEEAPETDTRPTSSRSASLSRTVACSAI